MHRIRRSISLPLLAALIVTLGAPTGAQAASTGAGDRDPATVPAAVAATTVYLPNITRMLGGPDGWQTPFIVQNVVVASEEHVAQQNFTVP